MALKTKRGAPREGAPQKNAFLAGSKFQNSDLPEKIQTPHAVFWLARRTGMSMSMAAAVASANSFGACA